MIRYLLVSLFLVFSLLIFVGCEDSQGPMGPTGPEGSQGEQGPPGEDGQDGEDGAGTRIVYIITDITSDDPWCYNIPEITLDDMPLVSVYVEWIGDPDRWIELPYYFEDAPGWGRFGYFKEGYVCFYGCGGLNAKIVTVI